MREMKNPNKISIGQLRVRNFPVPVLIHFFLSLPSKQQDLPQKKKRTFDSYMRC